MLYSEVINNQSEDNLASACEETGSVLCLCVTEFELGEMFDESIVGELASFGNTVHASTDFDEKVSELVLLHDAPRNDFYAHSFACACTGPWE